MISRTAHSRSRILRRIVLCLILGAAANVAVAWGVLFLPITASTVFLRNPSGWPTLVPTDWPTKVEWARTSNRIGLSSGQAEGGVPKELSCVGPHHSHYIYFRECGFPLKALQTRRTVVKDTDRTRGILLIGNRVFPSGPKWIGFTANTLLYGSISFAAFGGLRTIKKHQRLRRGLCANCAYDIAGLATCPECGYSASPDA